MNPPHDDATCDPPQTDVLLVGTDVKIPMSEFSFTFVKSSGPGGQKVNKTSTKARLRWPVATTSSLDAKRKERFLVKYHRRITADGDLIITSQRYRYQPRNIEDCLEKLRNMLATVIAAPKPRKKTKPSRAARARRLQEKREHSGKKQLRRKPAIED